MSDYGERIDALAAAASEARAAFAESGDPPDEERALAAVRDGLGPTLAVYVDARTGEFYRFDGDEFDRLERTMNDWLELYAACYGVEMDAAFTVREAADALVDTHDARAVARVLTGVPSRSESRPESE